MSKKRIIGFDVSSSVIGVCVLDVENKKLCPIDIFYYKPPKNNKSIFYRLLETKSHIKSIIKKYGPVDAVAIEEISKFMPNVSSAQTIITLALFNRIVGLTAFEETGNEPEMCSVMSIRHKLKENKVLPAKDGMPKIVETYFNSPFPYQFDRNKNISKISFDLADACAVAIYYCKKNNLI